MKITSSISSSTVKLHYLTLLEKSKTYVNYSDGKNFSKIGRIIDRKGGERCLGQNWQIIYTIVHIKSEEKKMNNVIENGGELS